MERIETGSEDASFETDSARAVRKTSHGRGADPRRVLILAAYFLPRRRVGSMRPFRFAIHLKEFGWAPTVVTIAAPGQRLTAKEERLLRDVDVIEVTSPIDRTMKSESQLGGTRRADATRGKTARWVERLDRQFPVDTWMLLYAARYRQLVDIVRKVAPDVLMATGDPWSSLVFGGRLAHRFRIPYVPDFRDPWTMSTVRTADQWGIVRGIDRHFERRVIDRASVVLFQSERVEQLYRDRYQETGIDSLTIPNSLDPDVFDDPIDFDAATSHAVSTGDGLRIGFFGRFRKMSPATLIADALAAVQRSNAAATEAIQVASFGPLSMEDEAYASARGVAACFRTLEPVPLERALGVLREFDILLLSTEESRTQIIPAKLFEYLAAGRPILSLSRNASVGDILQATGTGLQISSATEAADLLVACLDARRAGEPMPIPFDPNVEEIAKYDARTTTAQLAALLVQIVEPPMADPISAHPGDHHWPDDDTKT